MDSITNFIKKYLALLIPAGIAVFASLLFVMVSMSVRSLAGDIDSGSVSKSRSIRQLLGDTPPRGQFEQMQAYQDKYAAEADAIDSLSRQSGRRDLISYKIFPWPQSTSQQIFYNFADRYVAAIEEIVRYTNGRDAPGDLDITKELGTSESVSVTGRTIAASARDAMIDAICAKRAHEISVYANPGLFRWYSFWDNYKFSGTTEAVESCWYSQLACWVYRDVADTIVAMNKGSMSVFTSPVKRLVGIGFSPLASDAVGVSRGYSQQIYGGDQPLYVSVGGEGIFGEYPWTGRMCDDDMDIVHFKFSVIVDSAAVMSFAKELCSSKEHSYRVGFSENGQQQAGRHNQITILESEIEPVGRRVDEHKNYRYGDGAIVKLSLLCEYIFDRAAYDPIKPGSVKTVLGQVDEGEEEEAEAAPDYSEEDSSSNDDY